MVVCLEQGEDLHMAQLMPLLLTVSCYSKIQIGFTFLVPADPGSPGQRIVKSTCACVRACVTPLKRCVCAIYNVQPKCCDKKGVPLITRQAEDQCQTDFTTILANPDP